VVSLSNHAAASGAFQPSFDRLRRCRACCGMTAMTLRALLIAST